MTGEELEEIWRVKEALSTALHDFIDSATKRLTAEQDEILRQELTEQFRFWRRDK